MEVHLVLTDVSAHHHNANLKCGGSSAPHRCLCIASKYKHEVWRFICSSLMPLDTITIQTCSLEVHLLLTDTSAHHHNTYLKCWSSSAHLFIWWCTEASVRSRWISTLKVCIVMVCGDICEEQMNLHTSGVWWCL